MGPIIIHTGKNLKNKEKFLEVLKELIEEKTGIFPEYTDIIIYETSNRISYNKDTDTFVFCEMFAHDSGDTTEKKYLLHRIFNLFSEFCDIRPGDISGTIHLVKKEYFITPGDHSLIENMVNGAKKHKK